jgi:PAS domain S-box-containing protein
VPTSWVAGILNRSEALGILLEHMPAGVIALDGDGRIRGANRIALSRLGIGSEAGLTGRSLWNLALPPQRNRVRALLEQSDAGGACPVDLEFEQVIGPDGESRLFSGRLLPVRGDGGFEEEWLVILSGPGEPRRLEAELRESEARLRQIIDLVPHYIFAKNARGEFILVNQAIADAYGTTVGGLLGKTDADFNPNRDEVGHFREDDLRVIQSGRAKFIPEEKITEADGRIKYLQTTKIPYLLSGTGDQAILGVAVDITERKRAEEEAVKLEAELQTSRKLESLGVLAGGIAHDFNNLLAGILGNTRMALLEMPPDSRSRCHLEDVITACKRAAELCSEMLAYSGNGKTSMEAVDIASLVKGTSELLRIHVPANSELRVMPCSEPRVVEGDPIQIRQVIMNLAMNGLDAVRGRGGLVKMTTGIVDCSREYLDGIPLHDGIPEGSYVFIDVNDDGCGMDQSVQSRMFDPFFTTKFTGRGLGLSAVLGIVRAHKGAISVRSKRGRGTSIRVLLPAMTRPAPPAPVEQVGGTSDRVRGTSILVVDDEPTVLLLTQRILEHAGYQVLTAKSGEDAVDLYRTRRDEIAAVLLDMTMPGMSGWEVLEELRTLDRDVHVVLTSGYIGHEGARDLSGEAAVAFLAKPFEPLDLLEMLRQILGYDEEDA